MSIKLVTKLCLGLSHLRERKFKHSFLDTLNPLCNCRTDVESSTYFLFQCPSYINNWCTLMSKVNRINPHISQTSLQLLTDTLLFGNASYSDKTNTHILNTTIDHTLSTKRFDEPHFWLMRFFSFFIYISYKFYQFVRLKVLISFIIIISDYAEILFFFYFNYNCKIIDSYLLIVSFSFILLYRGWSMNQ